MSPHLGGLTEAMDVHPTISSHPPTVTETAANLWLPRDQVRHGFAGQLGGAAAGLAQLLGLAVTWSVAHVLFSTRTRAAIFALLLLTSLSTCAIATHA
ncbi:hypothetical protein [Actinoplanes sp. NPDC051494]|uniref:hypothetical protein n=1 Tax=Actinoplanes sp. NPDC051494 TaxID=3363907 RepID=UPI00379A0135